MMSKMNRGIVSQAQSKTGTFEDQHPLALRITETEEIYGW